MYEFKCKIDFQSNELYIKQNSSHTYKKKNGTLIPHFHLYGKLNFEKQHNIISLSRQDSTENISHVKTITLDLTAVVS